MRLAVGGAPLRSQAAGERGDKVGHISSGTKVYLGLVGSRHISSRLLYNRSLYL